MKIAGLQKLTLLDYPGKPACTIFTCGCNFRCPYCHNASLVVPGSTTETVEEDKLLAFLKKRKGILDAVVVTGGEPLLCEDLPEFLAKIKKVGFLIKLDTNGSLPERLQAVMEAGVVDYVAMDIKDAPSRYAVTAGNQNLEISAIEESKDYLLRGSFEYEFRTTVVKGLHTRESLVEAAQWITGAKAYYLQQFKDSGALLSGQGLSAFNEEEMKRFADAVRQYVPSVQLRGI